MKYLLLTVSVTLLSVVGCNRGTFSVIQVEKDGHPLFATVDVSLRDQKIRTGFPWYLSISTALKDPTKDGLTKDGEASELNDWEDLLEKNALQGCQFLYVGRVTWNGTRQLLYYLDRPDCVEPKLKKFSQDFPTRAFEYQRLPDEQWDKVSTYLRAR